MTKILHTRIGRRTAITTIGALLAAASAALYQCTDQEPGHVLEAEPELEAQGLLGAEPGGGFVPPTRFASGDITGVTAGTSLSGGGTSGSVTLNVNLPGATCSAGQSVTAISAAGAGTCSIPITNDYAGTHLEWVEEFMTKSTIASAVPLGIFSGVPVGTNAFVNDGSSGTTTRPGLFTFTTGTTATGSASLQTNFQAIDFGSGSWSFQWTGGFPTLSTGAEEYAYLVGFSDSTTINITDGCYLLYDRGNVATVGPNTGNADKWSCWCAQAANRTKYLMDGVTVSDETFTTVDSPIAALTLPSTNIYTVEIRLTGTTRAEFYVNGSKRCNINTNIPSGAARLTGAVHGIFKSAGGTSRSAVVDRTRVAVDLTSARSP